MVATESIQVERVKQSRISQVDFADLPFGKIYTDHMFMADYRDGEWKNLRVVPYGHISISPATPALHYGQSIFEGMKAMKSPSGEVLIFRAADNWMRLNISANACACPMCRKNYLWKD
jgi:branched-chain amino acid aminotransferase